MAITFVQTAAGSAGAATSASAAFASNVGAGNLVVVALAWDGSATISSVKDGNNASFSAAVTLPNWRDTNNIALYYLANNAGGTGSKTITVTLSAASTSYIELYPLEYSGAATSGVLEASTATGTGSGTTYTSSSLTTTAANDVLVAYVNSLDSPSNVATGFTSRNATAEANGENLMDETATTAGSYACSGTLTGTGRYGIVMAAFKAASSAVSGTLSTTDRRDIAAFSGATIIAGTISTSDRRDNASLSGGVIGGGALSTTDRRDIAAFSGSTIVSGAISSTDRRDNAAFGGGVIGNGVLATTDRRDVASFAGTVAGGAINGTLATTDRRDVAAFSGASIIAGTFSSTDRRDISSISGGIIGNGVIASTDRRDIAAFSGGTIGSGTLSTTDRRDVAAFSGASIVAGSMATTDGRDVASFSGTVNFSIQGTLAATDRRDVASFSGVSNGIESVLGATHELRDWFGYLSKPLEELRPKRKVKKRELEPILEVIERESDDAEILALAEDIEQSRRITVSAKRMGRILDEYQRIVELKRQQEHDDLVSILLMAA